MGLPSRAARILHLEDEAGVIVEIARESRPRSAKRVDVEPARRHEAGALLEGVERAAEVEPALAAASARIACGRLRPDRPRWRGSGRAPCARLVGQARAVRGPGEEALGDLAGAAAADAARCRRSTGCPRRRPAPPAAPGPRWRRAGPHGRPCPAVGPRARLVEPVARDDGADHAGASRAGGDAERIEERVEQPHVAELHGWARRRPSAARPSSARPGSPHRPPQRRARPMDSMPACRNSPLSPGRMRKTGPP